MTETINELMAHSVPASHEGKCAVFCIHQHIKLVFIHSLYLVSIDSNNKIVVSKQSKKRTVPLTKRTQWLW